MSPITREELFLIRLGLNILAVTTIKPSIFAMRFATGRPLSGREKTNATWLRAGTAPVNPDAQCGRWSYRPGWQRMVIRWAVLSVLVGTVVAYAAVPVLTTVAGVALLLAVVVIRGRRRLRAYRDERYHRTVVVPLAEALQALLPEWDLAQRVAALTVPPSPSDEEPVRVMLPNSWEGTNPQKAGLTGLISRRLGGEWDSSWQQREAPFYVEFTPKKAKAQLPTQVEWIPSDDPHTVMVGMGHKGPIWVKTETQSPHYGVTAGTGGGKTTTLLIPVIHNRQHGALVDYIDLKEDSVDSAVGGGDGDLEPVSGVRVHRDAQSAVTCLAEFFTSMKSIRTAKMQGYSDPIPNRVLVLDEFGSFMIAAKSWWRYGVGEKGEPPFMAWFRMSLMQGRTKNHRMVFGVHDFSLDVFGSSESRDLVGAKIVIGACSSTKWTKSFGNGVPKPEWNEKIPGRGVIGTSGAADSIEEIQMCYFTMDQAYQMLQECPPAPEWFDSGDIAPWITPEGVNLAHNEGHVRGFLPGGQYVTPPSEAEEGDGSASSGPVTAVTVTGGVTAAEAPSGTRHLRVVPQTYTLREAAEEGILPLSYDGIRKRKSRGQKLGISFPEGVSFGGVTKYTADELRDWWERVQAGANKSVGDAGEAGEAGEVESAS